MRRLLPCSALLLAVTLTACGGGDEPTDAAASTGGAEAGADQSAPPQGPAEATCDLGEGISVTLEQTETDMVTTWSGVAPEQEDLVELRVSAYGPNSNRGDDSGGNVTVLFQDGQLADSYVIAAFSADPTQTELAEEPVVDGSEVTATVPLADAGGLDSEGIGFWTASVFVDGQQVGRSCEDESGASVPFPEGA